MGGASRRDPRGAGTPSPGGASTTWAEATAREHGAASSHGNRRGYLSQGHRLAVAIGRGRGNRWSAYTARVPCQSLLVHRRPLASWCWRWEARDAGPSPGPRWWPGSGGRRVAGPVRPGWAGRLGVLTATRPGRACSRRSTAWTVSRCSPWRPWRRRALVRRPACCLQATWGPCWRWRWWFRGRLPAAEQHPGAGGLRCGTTAAGLGDRHRHLARQTSESQEEESTWRGRGRRPPGALIKADKSGSQGRLRFR